MQSRSRLAVLLCAGALVALGSAARAAPDKALEARFDGMISTAEMDGWLKTLAAEPNHVGSAHDKANAELTLSLFKSWGWDARMETFWVLYPTPKEVALDLVSGAGAPFQGHPDRGADPGRRDLQPHQGRAAGLCRLPGRRRGHRAAGLRELRHAG
jgi:N-acetylated-alpha-linked acidic dipeptidase